jgi:hypothetical protein
MFFNSVPLAKARSLSKIVPYVFPKTVSAQCSPFPCVPRPHACFSAGSTHSAPQLYFIRHGESCWNFTFNRAKPLVLFRLVYTCLYEMYLSFSRGDSWIIDSPLW